MKKLFTLFLSLILIFVINYGENSIFLSVGNVKIVRQEPLKIKREDLNIIIEKDNSINISNLYTFENKGKYNIKSTFMFSLDQNTYDNIGNNLTNVKDKYIKNIKFYSNYKKDKHLRAVINFDEKKYDSQISDNIQREWFAISKTLESKEIGQLDLYYTIVNNNIEKEKKFVFNFDLVENFYNKNEVEILYINIINKSDMDIKNISYKGYNFNKIKEKNEKDFNIEQYELLVGNIHLDNKLEINFK